MAPGAPLAGLATDGLATCGLTMGRFAMVNWSRRDLATSCVKQRITSLAKQERHQGGGGAR